MNRGVGGITLERGQAFRDTRGFGRVPTVPHRVNPGSARIKESWDAGAGEAEWSSSGRSRQSMVLGDVAPLSSKIKCVLSSGDDV
jgi:hypothetical protein